MKERKTLAMLKWLSINVSIKEKITYIKRRVELSSIKMDEKELAESRLKNIVKLSGYGPVGKYMEQKTPLNST